MLLPRTAAMLFLALAPLAAAQEAPDPEPADAPEDQPLPDELPFSFGSTEAPAADAPEPEPVEARSFGGYRWEATAPPTLRDVADVAVHPDDSTLIALVTSGGSAWVSTDGGLRWREVLVSGQALGGLSADEDLLRDVEAFVEDVLDEVSVDDPAEFEEFEDAAAEAEAAESALQDAVDQATAAADAVRGDVDTGAALVEAEGEEAAPARVWWGPSGELFVGRFDGLHYSTDNGARFARVLDVPVHALAWLAERGLWVAGTADGVRWAVDPRGWIDAEDATTDVAIRDLSVGPLGVYAATDDGVYFAPDAQSWSRLGEPVDTLAIEADPDWEGGFWVSTPSRLLRSDDQGRTLRASLGAPLRGVVDIVRVAPGQILVATRSDGPWESMDGGTRFSPLFAGLQDADTRALSVRGRAVYLASVEGVFRLVDAAELALEPSPYVSLGALLGAATSREGLAPSGPTSAALLQKVLPSLIVEGYRRSGDALRWNGGTTSADDAEWRVMTRLVFSPRPGRQVTAVDDVPSAPTVLVVDGNVELVTDNEGLTGAMDRRGRRGAISYRASLVERITTAYGARVELAGRPRAELTLEEAVELELRLQELDAELDLLTEGTVSRWMLSQTEEG